MSEPIDIDDAEAETNVSIELSRVSKKKRKLTSLAWTEFTKIKQQNGAEKASCNHCKKLLNGNSKDGTSHLFKHLKHCVVYKLKQRGQVDIKQQMLQVGEGKEGGVSAIQNFKLDQEKSRHDLAHMVIMHELPFRFVEYEGFRNFVKGLQPLFRMVSRNTLKNDIIKIHNEEKQKLYDLLDNLRCRVSLTSDMWTSNQNLGYMSLTCHFIDDEWNLQKRIIAFSSVEAPHTGEVISNCILDKLYNWNIDKKLCAIVLDNCTTNEVVVRELKSKLMTKGLLFSNGEMFHVRCSTHILNLIVQDGMDSIREVIFKVRESVKYIRASHLREQRFNEIARQVRAPRKKIQPDSLNRWNSTFEMLETVIQFKEAFERLSDRDSGYKFAPSYEEWENVKKICKCLQMLVCFTSPLVSLDKYRLGLHGFLKENKFIERKSDLELYLDEGLWPDEDEENFDTLVWWKTNAAKYREVARMARDILAIPVSTVASESAFSTGGRTIDDYRSNLLPATVETLMCCQDWLRSSTKDLQSHHYTITNAAKFDKEETSTTISNETGSHHLE